MALTWIVIKLDKPDFPVLLQGLQRALRDKSWMVNSAAVFDVARVPVNLSVSWNLGPEDPARGHTKGRPQ